MTGYVIVSIYFFAVKVMQKLQKNFTKREKTALKIRKHFQQVRLCQKFQT